ncbi:two-component sensor histidine kinase [Sphaerisporangium melleum]|uniref:histidine kinase n=1 Tax=Sphaerisporangium melleum TaxID=321316 RepID=A0A917QV29_9ACTN|nr:HAMP domain-containing sensor histidine kinase [Sphaerisporangium melleum]GGK69109.1 two-component sensor histidine kinase [Sphaerisporangium melleum]GII68971.1 two-component sensor histidine kinase [Sphaerisporangium melleum]
MTRRTVRARLTIIYCGLFMATGVILLVTSNLVLMNTLARRTPTASAPLTGVPPEGTPAPGTGPMVIKQTFHAFNASVLRDQWITTGVIMAVLILVSVIVSWRLAGRVLRPLHHITATARRLSLSNLHERIALAGPADELRDLADTFDGMLERLQHAADSQRRFVANASHELRTPLAIQRTVLQLGLDDPSPEQLARVRGQLLEITARSEALIEGLLVLAQGERGLEEVEPVALADLVRQVAYETPAEAVTLSVDAEPFDVIGDEVLLARLVGNLVHNAVRYNRPGGEVDVRVSAQGLLTVRNTGPTVPEDRIGELFEPFRRMDRTRTRTGSFDGAGLGLSIVAAIAEAHGATLTAHPNPGGGLEVNVRFPGTRAQPRLRQLTTTVPAGREP